VVLLRTEVLVVLLLLLVDLLCLRLRGGGLLSSLSPFSSSLTYM